jgi:dihydroorotate dehydrogenase (NAD+) catalytic subunit
MKIDLNVNLIGMRLKNPLMNASGTFGFGQGFANINNPGDFGALVTKTITLKPRKGNPLPWMMKTPEGMINSVGLANEGIDEFIKTTISKYQLYKVPVIVSIAGNSIDEYKELAIKLSKIIGLSAIEINTSCPNVHGGNIPFGTDYKIIEQLTKVVKDNISIPIIVKLTPNTGKIEKIAKAAENEGANAISLINTVLGLAININTKKPYLGGNTGGISGSSIKAHGVYRVFETASCVKIPIIGVGGISDYKDVLEYIIAGASSVQIGTANYFNPNLVEKILKDLEKYLLENKIDNISKLIGSLRLN